MKNLLLGNCINNIHKAGLVLLYGLLCLNTSYVQAQNDTVIDVIGFIGSKDIEMAYDGGYVISVAPDNTTKSAYIKKINRKGETLWTVKPHSSELGDIVTGDIDFLSTGEMILSGHTFKYYHPDYPASRQADGLLIKIGTCGEVEWLNIETRLEGIRIGDGLRKMDISSNDDIWVNHYCGYGLELMDSLTDGKRGSQMIMNKYNSDGDLIAKTADEDVVGFNGYINDVIALDDGGCIVSGYGYAILPYYNQVWSDTNQVGYTRSIIIKYNADANMEWYHVYNWNQDTIYDPSIHANYFDNIVVSDGSWMIETDSNTFIVSGLRNFYNADDYGGRYNKQFLYEIDLEGSILRDTLYDNPINIGGYAPIKQLDDTTLFLVTNPVDFGAFNQTNWAELEVRRIDSRTFDVTGRWVDTTYAYYPTSKIEISHEGKVLIMTYRSDGIGTQIRVLNPETMRLDTIPTIDTHVYDSLCSGVYTPEDYVLPADTNHYEPIGFVEFESHDSMIEYLQNDKALLFVNAHKGGIYQLINASGQVIESGTLESGVVHKDVAYLPTGFYQVRLESENKTYHEKFVVR